MVDVTTSTKQREARRMSGENLIVIVEIENKECKE